MRYAKITWNHDFMEEPYELLCEISPADAVLRKIEFFKSGKIICDDINRYPKHHWITGVPNLIAGSFLAESEYAQNSDREVRYTEITSDEFVGSWKDKCP